MADKLIQYEVVDGVAVIMMDDPPANTYTHEMMRELDEAVLEARMDDSVHVIVLRGAGDRFFCAGADIGTSAGDRLDIDADTVTAMTAGAVGDEGDLGAIWRPGRRKVHAFPAGKGPFYFFICRSRT